jgi:DNA-binding transcriptional MerR regulator
LKNLTEHLYQASEFATRAGVTVRTLHHYDRLGLLKPSRRTLSGYRLYCERDLVRLQQIVTLKFIGLPLNKIKELLNRDEFDLETTLRFQREIIEGQRRHLDTIIEALKRAERVAMSGNGTGWEAFKKVIEVINMHKDVSWTDKYYSDEARAALEERRKTITQGEIEQGQRDWAALIPEVEAAAKEGIDPAGEKAQELASRWMALVESFTGGNKAVQEGLNKMHADKANWPASMPRPYSDEAMAFIRQAIAARKKG